MYHKNTNAKVDRANGISDTLCAFANGSKNDWDDHLFLTVFAINNVPHLLGACDFYNIERGFPAATLAKGLNAVVLGAPGAGSSVRIYVEGFYAP